MDTKRNKAEYMKIYNKKNAKKLKDYQEARYIKDKEKIALRKKKYRQDNPELVKQQKAKSYSHNKEQALKTVKKYYVNNLEAIKATKRKYRQSPKGRLNTYIRSAKARNYDFKLSDDEFYNIIEQPCHYCNQPKANGIDRLDGDIGYITGNVEPCCTVCNFMKCTTSYEDFIERIKCIHDNLNM